jgi:DNA-binding transcriptional MerR regulator
MSEGQEGEMREQVPDDLLKIGEFAEISDIPAKTLRYYDRIGLFKPVYVDPVNDYRYYSPDQLPRITRILTLKDLGLSLGQIARLLEDELSLSELRGMLRLKRVEIQEQLNQEQVRLARVEARLREIEEARLSSRREGGGVMRPCPHCGRIVQEPAGPSCPYCGKALTPPHAVLLPIEKPARELAVRSLGLLLAALALIAVMAGLVTVVADGRDAPELIARPLPESPPADPHLALLSVRYERLDGHGDLLFEGQIRNISDAPLAGVEAVVSLYDADPALITASHAPVEREILSPGEVSSFSVEIDSSPRAHSYRVIFQQPSGGIVSMRDERSN